MSGDDNMTKNANVVSFNKVVKLSDEEQLDFLNVAEKKVLESPEKHQENFDNLCMTLLNKRSVSTEIRIAMTKLLISEDVQLKVIDKRGKTKPNQEAKSNQEERSFYSTRSGGANYSRFNDSVDAWKIDVWKIRKSLIENSPNLSSKAEVKLLQEEGVSGVYDLILQRNQKLEMDLDKKVQLFIANKAEEDIVLSLIQNTEKLSFEVLAVIKNKKRNFASLKEIDLNDETKTMRLFNTGIAEIQEIIISRIDEFNEILSPKSLQVRQGEIGRLNAANNVSDEGVQLMLRAFE